MNVAPAYSFSTSIRVFFPHSFFKLCDVFDLVLIIFILFFQVGVRRLRVKAVKRLAVSAVSGRVPVALQLNLLHVKVMAMFDGLSCERERERERARARISAQSTAPVICEQFGLVHTLAASQNGCPYSASGFFFYFIFRMLHYIV